MIFRTLVLLTAAAEVLAATSSCTYDDANPSPTDIDTDFCSSFITDHCAAVTSLDPEKVSTYCGCLLTTETETASPAGNITQGTETATSSGETQAPATPVDPTSSGSSVTRPTETSSAQTPATETDSVSPGSQASSSTPGTDISTITISSTGAEAGVTESLSTSQGIANSTVSIITASQTRSSAFSISSVSEGNNSTISVTSPSASDSQSRPSQTSARTSNDTSPISVTGVTLSEPTTTPGAITSTTPSSLSTFVNSSSPSASTESSLTNSTASAETPGGSLPSTPESNATLTTSPETTRTNTPTISTPAGNTSIASNGTATWTTLSTPSDAGVSGTQTPVTIPGNVTVVTPSHTSSRYYNTSNKPPYQSPSPSSSSWAGLNTTSYRTRSSNPTISGVNATSVRTPTGTTGSASSTPDSVSWANATISTPTPSIPATRNDTRTPSGTPPAEPSNGTWTPVTGSITGSATTVAISELTTFTTPMAPLPSSSGVSWNSTTPSANTTTAVPTFLAANFTSVTRTAAVARETCYQLAQDPQGDAPRRALMRNAKLREQNATIPSPYIESVDFESEGIDPLWLTVRDSTESSHYLDISNKSQIAIVDRDGTSMKLDEEGIYFSTDDCRYDISITITNFLGQVADRSGVECSTGARMKKRLFDFPFTQTLVLRDQCDNPVGRSIRSYPRLSVGTSECTDVSVNESTGSWEFDCMFPGSESSTLQCQAAIKNDVVDFLTIDPFGGSCPDLSTVITTLGTTGRDFLSQESLRTGLFDQGLSDEDELEANRVLHSYQRMWLILQEIFAKNKSGHSALETYLKLYNNYRDFPTDICEDIHASELPLDLSLRAGASRFIINTLNFASEETIPQILTVQDPAKVACCAQGSVASGKDGENGACGYPAGALIRNGDCVCGKTAKGESVAFENTECDNFVGDCETDQDCSDDGHLGFVCMTGTCCGGGVCIDPYACSENGTQLVTFEPNRF